MVDFKECLVMELEKSGYEVYDDQLEKLTKYYQFLIEYNNKVNLTAITEPLEVIKKHFIDSLFPLKTLYLTKNAICCDVGTGAGFPGVPLAIMRPDIKMTLFDAINKRLVFLNELIGLLDLINCTTVHSRAEDAGKSPLYREKYDLVFSRAVARLNVLTELNLPLVRKNGHMLALKGPAVQNELFEAKKAITVLGGEVTDVMTDSSLEGYEHSLVIIKKVHPTPAAYPRKSGTPEKQPIL